MTWFKVDDSLHSHVKAMRAGEAALGLWVMAGSWSADQLTDGWIPAYAAQRLTPRADELAADLVRAGLWIPAEQDGESGWIFHDWDGYQPSKESVENRRQADADRRARWRHAKSLEEHTPESRGESQDESRRDTSRDSHEESRGVSVLPDPTRPVPVSSNEETSGTRTSTKTRGTRLPEDFAVTDRMCEWAAEKFPSVDLDYQTEKFRDHWRASSGTNATKRDWAAAWRTWIRNAAERSGAGSSRTNGYRPWTNPTDPSAYEGQL